MNPPSNDRDSPLAGAALVVMSCAAVQSAAAVSSSLFDQLGVTAVVGLRQLVAAVFLGVVVRPRLAGRSRRQWVIVLVFGAAIAAMNLTFYHAVAVLPLGVAATLLYLGPFSLAAASIRRRWEIVLPVIALVGVALVSRPTGDVSAAGIIIGLGSAVALATYTLASQRAGQSPGLDTLSLAVACSALLLVPASVPAIPEVATQQWPILLYSGVVGLAVAFACDFVALRLAGTRVVATLFALDPAMGAVIGFALLSEPITFIVGLGITLTILAGATVTALTQQPPNT